jgi:methionine-rich copper-binding protein CopC
MLQEALPAPNETLKIAPSEVKLFFSGEIDTRFSTLAVYRLDELGTPHDLTVTHENLDVLVDALIKEDSDTRVDTGVLTKERNASEVVIGLAELEPGHYLTVIRALSGDTHVVSGYYVFTYAPVETE